MKWQPYPSYKDTGVEWLGRIPAQWEMMPLKRVLRVQSGDFLPPEAEVETGYPIYGGNGVRGYANKFNCTGPMILIGRVGAKCGCVHLVDGDFWASEHALRAFIQKPVELCYLAFLLRVLDFNKLAIRTAQPLINTEIVETVFSAMPPIDEQTAIAAFLDRETGKIDALVKKKERLIELLQEKRTALISHAVTQGLNPNALKRDSGIPWLGHIPKHWMCAPVCARYEVQLGKMVDTSRITGEHLAPYLRNIDVQWGRVNVEDLPQMDFMPHDKIRFSLKVGDLLVCEGGEVGRSAIWRGELSECYYQKAIHRLRPCSVSDEPRFMFYVLFWASNLGVFVAGGNSNTIDHLPADKLRKHRFASPPRSEQVAIADFLDRKTAKLDTLLAKVRTAIERLQEYRTALISAAVTGQIDVRHCGGA